MKTEAAGRWGRTLLLGLTLACAGCMRNLVEDPRFAPDYLAALRLPPVGPEPFGVSQLQGRVVLVSFLATWCFPCIADLPTLEMLHQRYAGRGLSVVVVGLDLEGKKVLEPFAYHYRMPFPILVADDRLRSGRGAFGAIRALPVNVLLDREGQPLGAYEGVANPEDLAKVVEKALR